MSKLRLNPIAEPATAPSGKVDIYVDVADGILKSKDDAGVVVAYEIDLGFTPEDVSNKATDLTSPDNTKYPTTLAVSDAITTAVTGLLDYRGSFDASSNLFPATGGSGVAGAILKGDFYICSVGGTLGGTAVTPGDLIIALVDTPAQTAGNWDLISHDINYVPENVANKSTTLSVDQASNTKYPSVKSVYDWVVATFQAALGFTPEDVANKSTNVTTDGASDTKYPSAKAVKTYADAKVDDTSYSSSWNGSSTIAPTKNAIFDQFDRDIDLPYLAILKALGSSIVGLPMGMEFPHGSFSMADGTAYYTACWVPRDCTITGVKFFQSVLGAYTADNNNKVGLYTYSSGTLTKVAESASDGNLWKQTSNTFGTKAFSSPYSATRGLYFVAMLYNSSAQTTAPGVPLGASINTGNAASFDLTNSAKFIGQRAGQTDLPSSETMSNLTGSFSTPNFQLYS